MNKARQLHPRSLKGAEGKRCIIQGSSHCVNWYSSRPVPVPWESRGRVDAREAMGTLRGRDAKWRAAESGEGVEDAGKGQRLLGSAVGDKWFMH